MKRTELRRKTPLKPGGDLKRSSIKAKPSRNQAAVEFSETVKRSVLRRSAGRCEVHDCDETIDEFHHRRMRSAGGMGHLENCMGVCVTHHRIIHDSPKWAYDHGYLVSRYMDPAEVPIR